MSMPVSTHRDPYCNFKNDDQRRRALNVRAISQAITRTVGVTTMAIALAHTGLPKGALLWLKPFIH